MSAIKNINALEALVAADSPQNAEQLVQRIFARTKRLNTFPQTGAIVEDYQDESVRELIEAPYRIIYRVREEHVEILGVFHGGQRLPKRL